MKAPRFWATPGPLGAALAPLGALYAKASALRAATAIRYKPPIPVFCAGNPTLGGSGKTPLARWLYDALAEWGARPVVVSRGHGGAARGPLAVDPERHDAAMVGDEPLMLARAGARVVIGKDRAEAARFAEKIDAGAIVLDDGLQNPSLVKDLAFAVVDGGFGFGNGRVFPAGPLREPLEAALAETDAIVMIGADQRGAGDALAAAQRRLEAAPGATRDDAPPILDARLEPVDPRQGCGVGGEQRRALAFAGVGRPEKVFETARAVGFDLIETRAFADHRPYRARELEALAARARARDAVLLTTDKDAARIGGAARAAFAIETLSVRLRFADERAARSLARRFLADAPAERP